MADNLLINTGTGPAIATDDISSVHYQKVKMVAGTGGTASLFNLGQTAMAGSLPVVIASNQSWTNAPVWQTQHPTRIQAFVISTTSAAGGTIIQTSGEHTLYLTDVLLFASGAMNVQLCSETTAFARVYLAANGFAQVSLRNPIALTTNQSFRTIASVASNLSVTMVGYTIT